MNFDFVDVTLFDVTDKYSCVRVQFDSTVKIYIALIYKIYTQSLSHPDFDLTDIEVEPSKDGKGYTIYVPDIIDIEEVRSNLIALPIKVSSIPVSCYSKQLSIFEGTTIEKTGVLGDIIPINLTSDLLTSTFLDAFQKVCQSIEAPGISSQVAAGSDTDFESPRAYKPTNCTVGVNIYVSSYMALDFNFIRGAISDDDIRKDDYQHWFDLDAVDDYVDCALFELFCQDYIDISYSSNCLDGFSVIRKCILYNSEYFDQSTVKVRNDSFMKEGLDPCYDGNSLGVVSVDMRVNVDFAVITFDEINSKFTLNYYGNPLFTVELRSSKSVHQLPTMLLKFTDGHCDSIEVKNIFNELQETDFKIITEVPVSFNSNEESIK